MGSYNFWAADRFTLGVTLHFLISREPLRHRFPKVLTLYFTTPACIYSLLFPLKCRYIRECHPYLIFPFIFLFCLKWRECWIGSEPSVITWNINANEEVCRRVNEVSVMWLSGSVHRRTSVVFIWTSHFFKLSLWFVTVYSLCWVFPMISSSKGQHFLWCFYLATRGKDISQVIWYLDYGNHHPLKWLLCECVIES